MYPLDGYLGHEFGTLMNALSRLQTNGRTRWRGRALLGRKSRLRRSFLPLFTFGNIRTDGGRQ
jgi:hypothetical protein